MFANTIGARKSSTGVVNNVELFLLHSIATRYKINVGVELAHYLYRQASDPRVKGIYCGGYITKLLQGMKVFKEPVNGSRSVIITRVTDGPFAGWGLEKLIQSPKRIYSTPPRPTQATSPGASTSQTSIDVIKRLENMEKEMSRERKKSKKFRAYVVTMLKRIGRCIKPLPTDLPTYHSSSESEDSSSESDESDNEATTTPAPVGSKEKEKPSSSKAPSKKSSSESEEEDDEEDDEEDEEEEEKEDAAEEEKEDEEEEEKEDAAEEEEEDAEEEYEEEEDDQGKKGD